MPQRKTVYRVINEERDYQDKKWANPESSIDEYVLYISGYTNELVQTASHTESPVEKLHKIRKIAALAVACMEQHGAYERKHEIQDVGINR